MIKVWILKNEVNTLQNGNVPSWFSTDRPTVLTEGKYAEIQITIETYNRWSTGKGRLLD